MPITGTQNQLFNLFKTAVFQFVPKISFQNIYALFLVVFIVFGVSGIMKPSCHNNILKILARQV